MEGSSVQSGADFGHLRAASGESDAPECSLVQSGCHTVTRSPQAPPSDWLLTYWKGRLNTA